MSVSLWGHSLEPGSPQPGTASPARGAHRGLGVTRPARPRVRTFPRDSALGRDTVRALMHYALKVWGDITPLNFHEVAGGRADIQIDFFTAEHDDRYPFDGPGGAVAHAFFPGDHRTAGDTHFDDEEAWAFRSAGASGRDAPGDPAPSWGPRQTLQRQRNHQGPLGSQPSAGPAAPVTAGQSQ